MLTKWQIIATVVKELFVLCLRIWYPVVLWLSVGMFFGFPTQTVLLICLVVSVSGMQLSFERHRAEKSKPKIEEQDKLAKDFYVVTNAIYEWDIASDVSRRNVEPELGSNEIFAFADVEAALIKYRNLETENEPQRYEEKVLVDDYHVKHKGWHSHYEEAETRLYVVSAPSKPEAYDMVWYDDRRKIVLYDERRHSLLMMTNNKERRAAYIDWWHLERKGEKP